MPVQYLGTHHTFTLHQQTHTYTHIHMQPLGATELSLSPTTNEFHQHDVTHCTVMIVLSASRKGGEKIKYILAFPVTTLFNSKNKSQDCVLNICTGLIQQCHVTDGISPGNKENAGKYFQRKSLKRACPVGAKKWCK